MININSVDEATRQLIASDIRVLNAFLLAENETAHVDRLLELMNLPLGAVVLDAGCGIGEIARAMQMRRRDLIIKLLNISRFQLDQCPVEMEHIEADFARTGLPNQSVDAVMFHYSICHSEDWLSVFIESQRILKEGGILFVNDMARIHGNNDLMNWSVNASAYPAGQVVDWAEQAGFVLDEGYFHTPVVNRLRDVFESKDLYDAVFEGVEPATWRFKKTTITDPIESAFSRHQQIAFQFSGGRDSTAALYLLRPHWDRMTVYHLDTGDQFPETIEVVKQVEKDIGNIVRIYSDVHAVRRQHGLASDLVPVDNSDLGRMVSGRETKIIGRYDCCARTLMMPMHERVFADGNTLIIRGQRDDEYTRQPMRSGDRHNGLEVLYPIQSWTGDQVSNYLKDNGLPIASFYERGAKRAPECIGCTAWWDEGRAAYMREYHPSAYADYLDNMKIIRIEIDRQYQMLDNQADSTPLPIAH